MNPIWYTTRQDLAKIFRRNGFNVITNLKDCPKDALWTYSMSVPVYLGVDINDLWDGPYLTPDPEYVEKWKWIKSDPRPKVGIRWTGNPEYEQDLHRSLPLKQLFTALEPFDFRLFSLQRDDGADEVLDFPDIMDLQDKLESFEDTLGLIANLDFVITSCTSIAHASAAMDKETYVLVPITAYYTWASTKDTSTIWYSDKVHVLRQDSINSWDKPISQLLSLLGN